MTSLRLRYQTIEFGKRDIHMCALRDRQQFSDPQGIAERLGISSATWPIFGVLWPASKALAEFMDEYNTQGKRILEVGCGLALPSLLLNSKAADITATDYHPEAQHFLQRNTELNGDRDIPFERVDWADNDDNLGLFDLVIGSDLLYEDQHVKQLAHFIDKHCKAQCDIIMVDPGRGRKTKLSKQMQILGYSASTAMAAAASSDFNGHFLKFSRH